MSYSTRIAGEDVRLLVERALFWPRRQTLFVADLHVGKAAAFRSAGSAIPAGSTRHDLERLTSCLTQTRAERLVILGDFYHARAGQAPTTMAVLAAWRERNRQLHVEVVRGNHDRRSDPSPDALRFIEMPEGAIDGPFVLAHHPIPSPSGYVLAGHVHPGAKLQGGAERLKLPCFHVARHVAVLPAFGSFTGLAAVHPVPGDRLFVIADDEIIEKPAH